jgi:hypothetical protein
MNSGSTFIQPEMTVSGPIKDAAEVTAVALGVSGLENGVPP